MIKKWEFDVGTEKKLDLLIHKIGMIIQHQKMKNIDKEKMKKEIAEELKKRNFNMYLFAKKYN
jgi:hypothetical protein